MLKKVIILIFLIFLVLITDHINHHDINESTFQPLSTQPTPEKLITTLNSKSLSAPISYDNELGFYSNTTQSQHILIFRTGEEFTGVAARNTKQAAQEIPQLKQIEQKTITKPTTNWQLSIVFDNDIFANRDFYYTNGLKINLIAPFLKNSPVNKILFGSKKSDLVLCGLSITHNMYTPINPDTTLILVGDRPFTSYLSFGQFRETYNLEKKLHIKSEINIGVLGPSSFGRQVQSTIHEIEPVGWQNQLNNDIVLSYEFEVEKGLVSNSAVEINIVGKTTLGTLYNKIGGGMYFRTGNFMPVFRGPFSFFENKNPGGRYQFWIFTSTLVDFIAYDATLQGGIFSEDNIYTISSRDISRLVIRASAGMALYYNSIGIEYEHFYLSPEFKGAKHFSWGRIKAVLAF